MIKSHSFLISRVITPIIIGLLTVAIMLVPTIADAEDIVSQSGEPGYSVGEVNDDGVVVTQDMIDLAPKPGSMRFVFFSESRSNPYSEQDLDHPLTDKDELPWGSRIANCDALTTWNDFHDCMFRPWNYGF